MSGFIFKSLLGSASLRLKLLGRSKTQKDCIRYFATKGCRLLSGVGCLSHVLSDQEFDNLLMAKRSRIDDKLWALNRLGLDESQVSLIPSIQFEGYNFREDDTTGIGIDWKMGKDGLARSSSYSISRIFFSEEQIFAYSFTFRMDCDDTVETTKEFFYDDITSLGVNTFTIENFRSGGCMGMNMIKENINAHSFSIHVPHDSFTSVLQGTKENMRAINAMKNTLRSKKNI